MSARFNDDSASIQSEATSKKRAALYAANDLGLASTVKGEQEGASASWRSRECDVDTKKV